MPPTLHQTSSSALRAVFATLFGLLTLGALAASAPAQTVPGHDFVIRDFKFESGETLPELRIHYIALGTPKKDAAGVVRNAVIAIRN